MKRIKLDLWDCYVYFLWMMVVHRLENSAIVVINGFAKNTLQLSWAVREPMIYVILAVMPHLAFVWLAYRAADKQYLLSGDRLLWMKTGWLYMLPGELIRLIWHYLCMITWHYVMLGDTSHGGNGCWPECWDLQSATTQDTLWSAVAQFDTDCTLVGVFVALTY